MTRECIFPESKKYVSNSRNISRNTHHHSSAFARFGRRFHALRLSAAQNRHRRAGFSARPERHSNAQFVRRRRALRSFSDRRSRAFPTKHDYDFVQKSSARCSQERSGLYLRRAHPRPGGIGAFGSKVTGTCVLSKLRRP